MVHSLYAGEKTRILAICIMLLLCAPVYSQQDNLCQQIERLKKKTLPEYAIDKLEEIANNLRSFSDDFITTLNEEDSLKELVRMINTTKSRYYALNHYIYGWNEKLAYLYSINADAVKRGVHISRTFVISDEVLYDQQKLLDAIATMEKQKQDGIEVLYGLQHELERDPDYHKYSLMDAGLSDDKVLAWVTAVNIKGPQPTRIFITWNSNIIRKKSPFPYLHSCPSIHPYSDIAREKLLKISKAHSKTTHSGIVE